MEKIEFDNSNCQILSFPLIPSTNLIFPKYKLSHGKLSSTVN